MPPPMHKFYRHILTYKYIIFYKILQKNKGSNQCQLPPLLYITIYCISITCLAIFINFLLKYQKIPKKINYVKNSYFKQYNLTKNLYYDKMILIINLYLGGSLI